MKIPDDKKSSNFGLKTLSIEEIENVEDICIHIVDSESRTICYSKGCEKIEGQKKENIIGKTIDELYTFNENTFNPHGSIQLKVLQTGKVMKNNRVKYKTSENKEIEVISSTYPVFSKDKSKVEAAICVFRDIGDHIKMANTIQKLESDLAATKRKNGTIYEFRDIIGSSNKIKECIRLAKKASENTAPVLIVGATGSGKEVFAQSIHNESRLSKGPFVALNCSAIPDNLLESTLFGTCKGAFTGATETKGLFELAKDGTLFLDEINSMNLKLQSKLLRVIENKLIRKVGGNEQLPINARIISATNQNPLKAIEQKEIRADLYYRLAVISLNLPILNERKGDIPELVNLFIANHSNVFGKNINEISKDALDILLKHNWPGNVRELKHIIDQSLYMSDIKDTRIEPNHLPVYIVETNPNKNNATQHLDISNNTLKEKLNCIERQLIIDEFNKCNENVSKTARNLGLTRQNLQHKLKAYDIK
ncbi:MAG TPA: sigma 54-interacting transcriptional regulator [Clostridia bacterium]|nr:sigma 54-interacting transcriptional regulator [Clostridia bacterium]